jgi:hypothetical protein
VAQRQGKQTELCLADEKIPASGIFIFDEECIYGSWLVKSFCIFHLCLGWLLTIFRRKKEILILIVIFIFIVLRKQNSLRN